MEFGIRWRGYPPSEDSYIPLWEAIKLRAMDVYAPKHKDLKWLVTKELRVATRIWVGMSQKESDKLSTFLMRSKSGDTWKKHENQWLYWIQFLRQGKCNDDPGEFLENCDCDESRLHKYMLFFMWLAESPRNLRDDAVLNATRAVKAMMVLNGINTKWMVDERIEEAKRASRSTNTEFRDKERRKPAGEHREEFLPLTLDMLERLRVESWGQGTWNITRLDSAALVLAIFLGFDSGFRVGHLASTGTLDKDSDHRLLMVDVTFVLSNGGNLRWNEMNASKYPEVVRLIFKANTSKISNRVKKKVPDVKALSIENGLEKRLIEDFLLWWDKAKIKMNDPIFTRYAPKRRELIRKDVSTRIKDLVESFNLPRNRFAPKSMRIGFASGSDHLNISEDQVKKRGGWSKNSNVQKKYYTKGKESGGLLSWSGPNSLSVREVKGMV